MNSDGVALDLVSHLYFRPKQTCCLTIVIVLFKICI